MKQKNFKIADRAECIKQHLFFEGSNISTPRKLVDEMIDKLPKSIWSNPDIKLLDPCCGLGTFLLVAHDRFMEGLKKKIVNEKRRSKHIVEKILHGYDIDRKKVLLCKKLLNYKNTFKDNIYIKDSLNEEINMKFDVIVGNPPYNQNIDLKFLDQYSDYLTDDGILLFVHPGTWLLDEKNKQIRFKKIKEKIGDKIKKIVIFNGNPIFKVSLFVPCVITQIDNKNHNEIEIDDKINDIVYWVDDINMINKYSNLNEYISLKYKILENVQNNGSISDIKNTMGKYYVNLSQIRGNVNKNTMVSSDFYTFIPTSEVVTSNKTKHLYFGFQKNIEAENFINYLKTNFARFCLSIYKNNSQLDRGELDIVPKMNFQESWTDEKLYNYFKLTKKEIKFIEKVIPKYY